MPHTPQRILCILAAIAIAAAATAADIPPSLTSLLSEIQDAIASSAERDSTIIAEISRLRASGADTSSPRDRYDHNHRLFRRYESFVCDSALKYLDINIGIAQASGDTQQLIESQLAKGSVLSKAGLFLESKELLDSIDPASVPPALLPQYYHDYFDLYQYLSEHASNTEYADDYAALRQRYGELTLATCPPDNFYYKSLYPSMLITAGDTSHARTYLEERLHEYTPGTREYSIMASLMAFCLDTEGDTAGQAEYLARSALSDITGGIKENMSLRALAELLYDMGDVDNANLLLKKSMDDAVFFSSRLRNNQSAMTLPLIDEAYQRSQAQTRDTLKRTNLIITAFAVVLLILSALLLMQIRKARASNRKIQQANTHMESLNAELTLAKERTDTMVTQLLEANDIKEVSLRYFMELCSTSINNLEQYRTSLYHKMKTGKTDDLRRLLSSNQTANDAIKNFYATFDSAFLSIFPKFVEQFNELFPEADRYAVKSADRLNTELRIYALIRMGINDSQKIADFLRCSLSTIYTYRSRVKNRATDPDNLDNNVMQIKSY